jgi:hypothetical protein
MALSILDNLQKKFGALNLTRDSSLQVFYHRPIHPDLPHQQGNKALIGKMVTGIADIEMKGQLIGQGDDGYKPAVFLRTVCRAVVV